ncbi:hypothetical protein FBU30_005190 [Linnemannia zychae]|nr:hypothetical protein FBU30_005190 [Linnemannia zychae]
MMITEPIDAESGTLPSFESTLIVAFPDVLMAGPKILLSSTTAYANSIHAWSHYCATPASNSKSGANVVGSASSTSQRKRKAAEENAVRYATVPGVGAGGIGLLTIAVAPPNNEQSTYLCEAIVRQAQASGTQHIILVAASNFASKAQTTHVVQLHREEKLGLEAVPKDVSMGDHILNTFLTLLTFFDIPTTALVHPAKKGTSLREARSIIENLTQSLDVAIGGQAAAAAGLLAEKAFEYNPSTVEEEITTESMMYL